MAKPSGLRAAMHVEGWDSYRRLDFDRREVRKGFRRVGRLVQVAARKRIRKGSALEDYPAGRRGTLARSISVKVSRPGFLVRVAPFKTPAMGEDFYPAYLFYGVTGKPRRKDRHAQVKDGKWRVKPRGNYMTDALEEQAGNIRSVLSAALAQALK
ncbi:hypothetical protein [Achromobacter mucicolens]|uniref:hypothetical protein n=1 Tax=Achromobacter mucicolens TaxID=1389922 RepID=UPI00289A8F76|nr:hypothetical protein [Achromobacter mucicolens]